LGEFGSLFCFGVHFVVSRKTTVAEYELEGDFNVCIGELEENGPDVVFNVSPVAYRTDC